MPYFRKRRRVINLRVVIKMMIFGLVGELIGASVCIAMGRCVELLFGWMDG